MNLKDYTRISAAISAVVIGSVFFMAALRIEINQGYSDFIVGSLAWHAGNKFQDLIAWPIFIISSFLSFSLLSRISSHLQETHGGDLNAQLVLWSLPFYAGAATLFLGGTIDFRTSVISASGIVLLGIIGFCKKKIPNNSDPNFWSAIILVSFLISLIPIELAVLLSRMPMGLVGDLKVESFNTISNFFIVFNFIFGIFAIVKIEKRIERHASNLILASQIGLPLFFLTLYPSRLLLSSGEIIKYQTTIYFKVFIVSLALYGVYDVIKRFQLSLDAKDWKKCFSPFALFGLFIALKLGFTVPPNVSPDDYHFGELLLGWWSYLRGFVPYVDFMPPHGLLEDYFKSLLSYIFYDNTAGSISDASRSAYAIIGFIAYMSIYYFTGSLVLAFSVVLLSGERLVWFFFVPFICLWLNSGLRTRPAKWLAVWIVSAPFVILCVPSQGILLVASFGFLAVKIAWDQIQVGDKKSWRELGLVALITSLAFIATPLLTMLVGAIRYVLDNAPINQIAYGIPWSISWNGASKSGLVFEAIRMSWVVIPLFCLAVMHRNWRNIKDSKSLFYPALIFFLFSFLLIPYSMGRIDPGNVSRAGRASLFGWTILFPLLIWGQLNANKRAFILLATVFTSTLIGLGYVNPSLNTLSLIASQKIYSPLLRDSDSAGLSNIGRAYVEDAQWNRINRLNKLLNSKLKEDETYLDLTSHNADYFYLNRLPAMSVSAPYNLVSPSQQKRVLKTLTTSTPKIALLQADNIVHDGGGIGLRNPYLYRFVIDHYVPRVESGFIIGYKKSEITTDRDNIIAEIKDFTDANWYRGYHRSESAIILSDPKLISMLKIGDKVRFTNKSLRSIIRIWPEGSAIWFDGGVLTPQNISSNNLVDVIAPAHVRREYDASLFHRSFSVSDLQKIPISWGRSEKNLKAKMIYMVSLNGLSPSLFHASSTNGFYKIMGEDPQLLFDTSTLEISGTNSGLLKFEFNCSGMTSDPKMQIYWWGDEQEGPFEDSSVKFSAYNGTLIVPLDASPWWLSLRKIKGLRFDLDNSSACSEFSVKNISLFQRS